MNVTAFIVALVISLSYYVYSVRKERARCRQTPGFSGTLQDEGGSRS